MLKFIIEKSLLTTTVIYYFAVFVACFISPLIVGLAVNGIDGLKDEFNMILTDKNYYLTVVKPLFIIFTCIYIICILFTLVGLFIVKNI